MAAHRPIGPAELRLIEELVGGVVASLGLVLVVAIVLQDRQQAA